MNQPTTYFKIDVIGQVALIDLAGLWIKEVAFDYQKAVLKALDHFKNKKVFPISNMVNWSLPPLEVMEITNQVSLEVAQVLDFKHSVLLTQKQHLLLFEDVINQFNLVNTQTEAKAFSSLSDALEWGENMGYSIDNIPLDHFTSLSRPS